jgi:hypothetical protein
LVNTWSAGPVTLDLTSFELDEMTRCGAGIRAAADGAPSMERAAGSIVRYFYDELAGADGARACALVRCYKTHAFGMLPDDLKRYARRVYGTMAFSPPDAAMKGLTRVATIGDEPEWNDRRASKGHQAIPLPTPHVVERAPMIAQLIRELGLDIAHVVQPGAGIVHGAGTAHGIFHVERAAGSPYVPAQDFVERYAIRSVLGFGGALGPSDLFAIILFARVPIPYAVADQFRPLAAEVARVFDAFADTAVFDETART